MTPGASNALLFLLQGGLIDAPELEFEVVEMGKHGQAPEARAFGDERRWMPVGAGGRRWVSMAKHRKRGLSVMSAVKEP